MGYELIKIVENNHLENNNIDHAEDRCNHRVSKIYEIHY